MILNEKCAKRGWERPVIDLYPVSSNSNSNTSNTSGSGSGVDAAAGGTRWTGTPTLRKRRNKNAMDLEVVRLGGMPEPAEGWPCDAMAPGGGGAGGGGGEGEQGGQGKALGRCYVAVWGLFRVSRGVWGFGVCFGLDGLVWSRWCGDLVGLAGV